MYGDGRHGPMPSPAGGLWSPDQDGANETWPRGIGDAIDVILAKSSLFQGGLDQGIVLRTWSRLASSGTTPP